MMTQADVIAESTKIPRDESSTSGLAVQANSVVLNAPDLVLNQNVGYKYDQDSDNGQVQLGVQSTDPKPSNPESMEPLKYFAQDSAINASKGLRNIIIGGMTFSGIITVALIIQIAIGSTQVPYRIGIVTQEEICSKMGADMVHMGGKSIDAFITSSLCLGVVNPYSAGPGAGGFLLIRDHKHDKNVAMNCFFKSSEMVDSQNLQANPVIGTESIGIPGEFKCLREVYRYARFGWKKLTQPVIDLANNGFRVTKNLADNLKKLDFETEIKGNPYMAEIYIKNGKLVEVNDVIYNKRLARTIEKLRDNDNDMYDGDGARSIQEASSLTNNDLRNYQVKTDSISETNYNDFKLLTAPFPSNGPIVKYVVELMHTLSLKMDDFSKAKFYTDLLRATDLGYKMSAYTADPVDTTLLTIYEKALSDSKEFFSKGSSAPNPLADFPLDSYEQKDDFSTHFVSVNDHNDLMVSYTGTLGSAWGSKVMTKDGFMMNNALNFFTYGSQNSNENNGVGPNKQPRALFTPILAYNDKNPCVRRFAVSYSHKGSVQNDFGLTELTEVILKLFTDYKLYESAIADHRIQYNFDKGTCFENGFDNEIKSSILGNKVYTEKSDCMYHGIDLIMKKDHIIYSKVDNRSMDYAVLFNK